MNLQTINKYIEDGLLYKQVHPTLPLTILNYTDKVQWENLWNEITLSCRGLVVDDLGNVVARPFKKFFNLSEGKTNITDDYTIYAKLDGSLGILFCYNDEWILASRGSFTSEQAIIGKEILDKVCDYSLLDKNNTYCFEIIYPENKIVVEYEGFEGLVLTGVFNTATGEEQSMGNTKLQIAQVFSSDTHLSELYKTINDNEEGYVIRFSNGERCKIKGAEYLRLHKMMSEMSTTAVWNCLRNGDSILDLIKDFPDEFYNAVRDYEELLKARFEAKKGIIQLKFGMCMMFNKDVDNKTFALNIQDSPFKHFLFSLRNGKNIDNDIWKTLKPEYKRL